MNNAHNPLLFRLLDDNIKNPFLHFAVEETLFRGVDEGTSPPTLRLRTVDPSVFIGVYQSPEEDVDVEFCRTHNIPVVRRPNPGGAVYQDEGSFCFSLFFKTETIFPLLDITEPHQLYERIGKAVEDTCFTYGVTAAISPVNDVTINGRKVYGSAQVQWYSAFVHSGTFLVCTDTDMMQKVLKPSILKFSDKGFHNVKDRVINLSEAANKNLNPREVMLTLSRKLSHRLGLELNPGVLMPHELETAAELDKVKYSTPQWTFRNQPHLTHAVSIKARSGVIVLSAEMESDNIKEISIKGDFLIPDQTQMTNFLQKCKDKNINEAVTVLDSISFPCDLRDPVRTLLKSLEEKTHAGKNK